MIEAGFRSLPVSLRHAAATADVASPQGDPFDRLLLAQCEVETLRLLERVVGNLVDNAVKYSSAGGEVRVELARKDGVELVIRDEGPGIPPDQVPHLFVRFFRGDPARQRGDGTGLGLAIARAGAEAHGGRVEYIGDERSAAFRVTLPIPSA